MIIKYGDKSSKIKLYLSEIYRIAKKLKKETESDIKEMPKEKQEEMFDNSTELIFPEAFMYNIYRIFTDLILPQDELNKLKQIMTELTKLLRIEDGKNDLNFDATNLK